MLSIMQYDVVIFQLVLDFGQNTVDSNFVTKRLPGLKKLRVKANAEFR